MDVCTVMQVQLHIHNKYTTATDTPTMVMSESWGVQQDPNVVGSM